MRVQYSSRAKEEKITKAIQSTTPVSAKYVSHARDPFLRKMENAIYL